MRDFIRKLLTKRILVKSVKTRRVEVREVPPSENLVVGAEFAIAATAILTILEIVHIVCLKTWNSEIFAAITGLIGTVMGLFVGART